MIRRLVDWCVPDSALRWGELTAVDSGPSWYFRSDGTGTVYMHNEVWPVRVDTTIPRNLGTIEFHPDEIDHERLGKLLDDLLRDA